MLYKKVVTRYKILTMGNLIYLISQEDGSGTLVVCTISNGAIDFRGLRENKIRTMRYAYRLTHSTVGTLLNCKSLF